MNDKVVVNPVVSSRRKREYSKPLLYTPEKLAAELKKRGLTLLLNKQLKGGFVSQVYEASLNGKPVVVKHTENIIPFDPTEIFISKEGHNTDSRILKLLQNCPAVRVPKKMYHFPEITTTIMEDLRQSGFTIMSDQILEGTFSIKSASLLGKSLAELVIEAQNWKYFPTNLSAEQNAYERGLELRLAYPNTQTQYLYLEKNFTEHNKFWTWLDGHPKNIFTDKNGHVAFIDFGNSSFADQRFTLPNFLAHVVIYALAGFIDKKQAATYIATCIKAYQQLESIDEIIFCQYLAMEVLHRANGKWIQGIETAAQKMSLYKFGLSIFDDKIITVSNLLKSLIQ